MGQAERANPFNTWRRTHAVTNSLSVFDRFGREIGPEDILLLPQKHDALWRVVRVRPLLDPGAPPGAVELTLTSAIITGVPGGQPLADLVKVVDATERPSGQGPTAPEETGEPSPAPGSTAAPASAAPGSGMVSPLVVP